MARLIPLLAVGGPTASGKTGLAVALAKALGGEIICADSMQVYRGMEIGTASPTPQERQGVPHHLFGILEPGEEFSVARYLALARPCIGEIASRGRLPILCGGTGLYLSSLIDHISFEDAIPQSTSRRLELQELAKEKGSEHLWKMLWDRDPALAERLHPNNLGRVIRGLEVYEETGVPMSEWQRRSRASASPYHICLLALSYQNRELLYDRINRRVDHMLEAGLLDEVRRLLSTGSKGTAMQAIGYKELADHLAGKQPLEEAVEHLKRQTRRYAKRQLTWLRRDPRALWLYPDLLGTEEALLGAALEAVRQSGLAMTKERP